MRVTAVATQFATLTVPCAADMVTTTGGALQQTNAPGHASA
jgi:hypothetical protein